jgi:hypothetical protein
LKPLQESQWGGGMKENGSEGEFMYDMF